MKDLQKRSIETIPEISKKKFILSTIIPLVLFFVLNLVMILIISINNPNRGYDVIKQKWNLIHEINYDIDWLIIGDSSCNQGFNNNTFDDALGGKSLNLCTTGSMLLTDGVWQTEALIKKNISIKNILIIHGYDVWEREEIPELSFQQIPKLKFDPVLELPFNQNKSVAFLPLIYQVSSLKQIILNPKKVLSKSYYFSGSGQQIIDTHKPQKLLNDKNNHSNAADQNPEFKVSKINLEALNSLVHLADQNQIQLFYAHAPYYKEVFQNESFSTKYKSYQQTIDKICSDKKIKNLLKDPSLFEKREMEGTIEHILYPASKKYTEAIIKSLNE